jgi:ribosome biogenesis GTPase A
MGIHINQKLKHMSVQILKQFSNVVDDFGESVLEIKNVLVNHQNSQNIKSLKIAILGLPNVGKSTLINVLIGRPVNNKKKTAYFVELYIYETINI